MSRHEELRQWLKIHQFVCPVCGKRLTGYEDLHHLFVRRMRTIDHLLWCKENISLVCSNCHVPEAPDLNYMAAVQKWHMGFTPQGIREWIDSLPTREPIKIPRWFLLAEEEHGR